MKKALLVIDVQNEYLNGKMKVTYPEGSLKRIGEVMEFAKMRHIPIVVIQHTSVEGDTFVKGTNEWELCDEVSKRSYDYLVEKNYPSSFCKTNLEEILRKEKITGVVIAGYMTQMCCDTTARVAFHKGYQVEFLSDATGTIDVSNEIGKISSKELHEAALITQSMVFSQVLSAEEWMRQENNK